MKKDTPNLELVLSDDCNYRFWIKPRTINLNGIEVPAPFKPKEGERYFYIANNDDGYMDSNFVNPPSCYFGAWRTEEEIKQVVEALRNVFNT